MTINLKPLGRPPISCALCLQNKPLRDSHIIPEFVYESVYDDKHRFHTMAVGQYSDREQKGLREPLLCQTCETKLSVWEGYARSVMVGEARLRYEQDGELTWLGDLDYARFKLFLMSVLWRAGVAKGPFWEQVNLGPHEKTLREMLWEDRPGAPDQYGCLVWRIQLKNDPATLILQPTTTRVGTRRGYRFTFAGCFWAYTVASHPDPALPTGLFLQPTGRMLLGPSNDIGEAQFFMHMMQRMKDQSPAECLGADSGTARK